jgi:hypothetical protein
MDGTTDILRDMDAETLVATAKMSASCIEAGLDMRSDAVARLLRELADRLEAGYA